MAVRCSMSAMSRNMFILILTLIEISKFAQSNRYRIITLQACPPGFNSLS